MAFYPDKFDHSKKTIFTFSALFVALIFLSAFLMYDYHTYLTRQRVTLRLYTQQEARTAGKLLDEFITQETKTLYALTQQARLQNFDQQALIEEIKKLIYKQYLFHSLGVYYLLKENTTNKSFVCAKKGMHEVEITYISNEDYVKLPWLKQAALQKEGIWSEPYKKDNSEIPAVSLCMPIHFLDKATGTYKHEAWLVGEIDMHELEVIFEKIIPQNNYQLLLFSHGGIALYHSVKEYVQEMYSIEEIAKRNSQSILSELVPKMLVEAETTGRLIGDLENMNEANDYFQYVTYVKIPCTKWNLCVLGQSLEELRTSPVLQRKMIHIVLSCVSCLLILFFLLGFFYQTSTFLLWVLVFTMSIVFSLMTLALWFMNEFKNPRIYAKKYGEIVETYQQSSHFLRTVVRGLPEGFNLLENQIPTGIFIDDFEINKDNSINLTGYLWHRFNPKIHQQLLDKEKPLVDFIGIGSSRFIKTHQVKDKKGEAVGWKFELTFRPDFNFELYPLDHQVVPISIRSIDLAKPIIFSPDFSALRWQDVHLSREISQEIFIYGWSIQKAYKGYHLTHFPIAFGIQDPTIQNNFPELTVYVVLKRYFASIMLGVLLPIFLTLLILFVAMILACLPLGKNVQLMTHVSFAGASTLATIIPHSNIRTLFPFNVPYVEYFYFITYLFIFLVLINNILVTNNSSYKIITYRNNLLARIFYWPLVTFMFFLVTLYHFY